MEFIAGVVVGVLGYAIVKHIGLTNLKSEILAELAKLESAVVHPAVTASVAKIKSLF